MVALVFQGFLSGAEKLYSPPGEYDGVMPDRYRPSLLSAATGTFQPAVGPGVAWQSSATVIGILLAVSIVIYIIIRILTHRHEDHGPEPDRGKAGLARGKAKPPRPQS